MHLAVSAYEELVADGVRARVVSLPSWYLFDHQDEEYRESVLPAAVTAPGRGRAGLDAGLGPLRRPGGRIVGMHTFGASAPLKEVQSKFGFTPEKVVEAAARCCSRGARA